MLKILKVIVGIIIVIAAILILLSKYGGYEFLHPKPPAENTNNETIQPTPVAENIFPEPNKPPYYYAHLNKGVLINDDWEFRMTKVVSDSRCPKGVECFWAGETKVIIEFGNTESDIKPFVVELKLDGLNRNSQEGGEMKPGTVNSVNVELKDPVRKKSITFRFTFLDLSPYPQNDNPIDINSINYTGLFRVDNIR